MRGRLTGLVAATTSMVALAFLLPLLVLTVNNARDEGVRPAELAVRSIAPAVALTGEPTLERLVDAATTEDLSVGVRRPDGTAIGAVAADRVAAVGPSLSRTGTVEVPGGVSVVAPVVRGDGTWVVHATVPDDRLRVGVVTAGVRLVGLAVVLVGGAVLLARQLASRTLEAVARLEVTAERLGRGELDARAGVEDPPEVARVGDVLARLAERIEELLAAERDAAADLGHRLRTPLTPLRVDAAHLSDPGERARIEGHVIGLERAVSHVLRAMRSSGAPDGGEGTDLAAVVRERAAFWGALAEDEGRVLDVVLGSDPVLVGIGEDAACDLVDVLVDNVFTHTPEGTALRVELRGGAEARLVVADEGGGFDPASTRRGDSSREDGTGLGLDIARRHARLAGGTLDVTSGPDGTAVEVVVPVRAGTVA